MPIDSGMSDRISDGTSADSEVMNAESKEMLHRALSCISQKYTAVLTLKYMQNLSVKEIGEVLNMPPKTVETQLYRARSKLKESLETLGYNTEENNNGL